ncbi:MAG: HTTM domain-containing protein, partial [Trueperaceae bacterium]
PPPPVAVAVAFGYLFLLDATRYLNHFYLVLLLAALLTVVPTHGAAALSGSGPPSDDRAPPGTAPRWALWLLRVQIGVPYVFGGIAKLNVDWLQGRPIGDWLAARAGDAGPSAWLAAPAAGPLFAYGGLALDLAAPFALLHPRTRLPAFVLLTGFHLLNAQLFSIGMFPFLMIAANTLFFPPDWPQRAWERARAAPLFHAVAFVVGAATAQLADPTWDLVPMVVTGVAVALFAGTPWIRGRHADRPPIAAAAAVSLSDDGGRGRRGRAAVLTFVAAWSLFQAAVPLRHHVLPGDVAWNEAGHRFSWRMKLRSKQGTVRFLIRSADGSSVYAHDFGERLASFQRGGVAARPYLTLAFAHHLADRFERAGAGAVEIRAVGEVSLNGRPARPLIDPTVDLAALPRGTPSHGDWVTPSPR